MNLCTKLAGQVQSGLIAAAMDERSLILNHLKPEHNCFRVKRPMKTSLVGQALTCQQNQTQDTLNFNNFTIEETILGLPKTAQYTVPTPGCSFCRTQRYSPPASSINSWITAMSHKRTVHKIAFHWQVRNCR